MAKKYTPSQFLDEVSSIDNLEMFESVVDDMDAEELEDLSRKIETKRRNKPFSGSPDSMQAVRRSSLTYSLGLKASGLSEEDAAHFNEVNGVTHSYPLWFGERMLKRDTTGGHRYFHDFIAEQYKGVYSNAIGMYNGALSYAIDKTTNYVDPVTSTIVGKDCNLDYLYQNLEKITLNTLRFITHNVDQLTNALRQASLTVFSISKLGSVQKNSFSLATFISKDQLQKDIIDIPLNLQLGQNNILSLEIAGNVLNKLDSEITATFFLS